MPNTTKAKTEYPHTFLQWWGTPDWPLYNLIRIALPLNGHSNFVIIKNSSDSDNELACFTLYKMNAEKHIIGSAIINPNTQHLVNYQRLIKLILLEDNTLVAYYDDKVDIFAIYPENLANYDDELASITPSLPISEHLVQYQESLFDLEKLARPNYFLAWQAKQENSELPESKGVASVPTLVPSRQRGIVLCLFYFDKSQRKLQKVANLATYSSDRSLFGNRSLFGKFAIQMDSGHLLILEEGGNVVFYNMDLSISTVITNVFKVTQLHLEKPILQANMRLRGDKLKLRFTLATNKEYSFILGLFINLIVIDLRMGSA